MLIVGTRIRIISSIDNGLGLLPPLSWRSWNAYHHNISQDLMMQCIDALIVLLSCHGIDQHILTSDYKKVSKKDIHRTFSRSGQSRDIPRLFIFDCCSGEKQKLLKTRQKLTVGSRGGHVAENSAGGVFTH